MKPPDESPRKILILGGILILALVLLLARMWYVQIHKYADYKARTKGHSQLTVRLPAVRGEICDRRGVPLVENRASMEVEFYLPDIVRAWKEEHDEVPVRKYWGLDHGMRALKSEPDIVKIVNESIVPHLEKLGLAGDYNSRKLQVHFRDNSEVPYVYRQDLDFETMARFSEQPQSAGRDRDAQARPPLRLWSPSCPFIRLCRRSQGNRQGGGITIQLLPT
jgi:penicillin-binding protein 2